MKNIRKLLSCFSIALLLSCNGSNHLKHSVDTFDEQAHRGGRGLMPENTIASEKNAIDFGCTLEMDLQMSKDKKIVVSHDAYFNNDFCLTPAGDTMSKKDSHSRLLFNMPYDSIAQYEVGLKPHPGFPHQKKIHATKPLLSELIDSVEAYAKKQDHANHYNIEIKSNSKSDGKFYSTLEEYVDLAMSIILEKGIAPHTMIQSFDIRALNLVHKKYPAVKTSFLVGKTNIKDAKGYIAELGFKPDIFSPEYSIVTPQLVKEFHEHGVLVIPWTPNTVEELQHLRDMGADGAITDYPDLYAQIK